MPAPRALLLFDIDGTLVRVGGAGRRALDRAIEEHTGVARALDSVRLDGGTDPGIVHDGFAVAVGRAPSEDELAQVLARYLSFLEEELARRLDSYTVLPGVVALLEAAASAGHLLGLATGNVEEGARKKLAPGDLNRYFRFGGYGSDARERARLVERGLARGRALAGFQADEPCWVLGDTELDVRAAHAAGARAVGVRFGSANVPALEASRPELLVDSLEDAALWRALGL